MRKRILLTTAVSVLLIAGIALVVMYNLGDMLIEEAIREELKRAEAQGENMGASGDAQGAAQEQSARMRQAPAQEDNTVQEPADAVSNAAHSSGTKGRAPLPDGDKPSSDSSRSGKPAGQAGAGETGQSKPQDTDAIMGGGLGNTGGCETKEGTPPQDTAQPAGNAIPVEKIEKIKSRVTVSDRISAAALLMKRLSIAEIAQLQAMVEGGVSEEEKEKAKEIAYSKFNEKEIKKIKEIYRRYMTSAD